MKEQRAKSFYFLLLSIFKNLLNWTQPMLVLPFLVIFLLTACNNKPLNNPYPSAEAKSNTYYSSFSAQPKTLDPARSYSSDETIFIAQIYEPPLQYHYLKRPYTLVPLTATEMPKVSYLNAKGEKLSNAALTKAIAYSVYEIQIKPGIYYQPHPAFARTLKGNYFYHNLTQHDLTSIHQLNDFKYKATRELVADDYVYEIKRLADPRVQSPIYGFLSHYIVGFTELNAQLAKGYQSSSRYIDLRQYPLKGVNVVNKYTYRIILKGYYPQFLYWLAMPFFAPIPWEADCFYSQPGMSNKNISFNWYPVGTGPYLLAENNPNRQMVLARNPKFHGEIYPDNGDKLMAGKKLPLVDKFVFSLEKESIPRWTKFLQGYYDQSAISSDSFDQAITVDAAGNSVITPELKNKNIYLQSSITPDIFYWGFNMLDPVVGGYSERARKLRQAIALAVDTEEFISIFLNGRGIAAQSPIPPGIFGYQAGAKGLNPYIYRWLHNQAVRKNIDYAKQLLQEAGYPNGMDVKAKTPLILNYDVPSGGTSDDKAMLDWIREQFAKLGIQLQIRDTQYNRFQEIVRTGQAQIYFWGWSADYPDPENFLFLLYGPNGKVAHDGENASNYSNPEYDALFEQMRDLPNGIERQTVINKMLAIIWRDTPWIWGFHPKQFVLTHVWVMPTQLNDMARNTLKYVEINPEIRADKRIQWNNPTWWPLWLVLSVVILSFIPVFIYYWRQQNRTGK